MMLPRILRRAEEEGQQGALYRKVYTDTQSPLWTPEPPPLDFFQDRSNSGLTNSNDWHARSRRNSHQGVTEGAAENRQFSKCATRGTRRRRTFHHTDRQTSVHANSKARLCNKNRLAGPESFWGGSTGNTAESTIADTSSLVHQEVRECKEKTGKPTEIRCPLSRASRSETTYKPRQSLFVGFQSPRTSNPELTRHRRDAPRVIIHVKWEAEYPEGTCGLG